MIKPWLFLTAAAVFAATCMVAATPSPSVDAFAGLAGQDRLALDRLAVEDIAALKLLHLERAEPFEVLILGNSRSLPLTAADIGLPEGRMFNASLTGESLRASVLLLEALAGLDRLPAVALVSLDNLELNYYGNPQWPSLGRRWRQMARDLGAGLTRPDIPTADLLRMATRHARTEATILGRRFNAERVGRGLWAWAAGLSGTDDRLAQLSHGPQGYGRDGSRPPPPGGAPVRITSIAMPNRNLLPGYLDYDLDRLAQLQARGMRVVIFETMLHPDIHAPLMAAPSSVAAEARAALLSLCARHGIQCHPAPPDYDPLGLGWTDSGHPPPPVLGSWLRLILTASDDRAVR